MKCLALLLFSVFCLQGSALATDLVISNNAIIGDIGDSFQQSDAAGGMVTGYRMPDYLESYFKLKYPGSSITFWNFCRSGQNMDGMLTNIVPGLMTPVFGYQFNQYQKICLVQPTDNGSLTSNQMYSALSNLYIAPAIMSTSTLTLVTMTGWAATNHIQWIGLGDPPGAASDGGAVGVQSVLWRNNASVAAGNILGFLGVDSFNILSNSWTGDYRANGGTNVQFVFPAGVEHFLAAGGLSWAISFIRGITTDSNISTASIAWAGTVTATNHCCVTGVSVSGFTMTFTRKDDRLPMAWDVPDGVITNDARTAFALIPADADAQKYTLQITGMPDGLYQIQEDGIVIALASSAQLAAGYNFFTNMSLGPTAAQRKEVLGRIRDKEHIDRVTLIPQSVNGHGMFSLFSAVGTYFPANQGDALITSGITNNVADIISLNALIDSAALPVVHTYTVMKVPEIKAPFRIQ
jgi:hypothetical protein